MIDDAHVYSVVVDKKNYITFFSTTCKPYISLPKPINIVPQTF